MIFATVKLNPRQFVHMLKTTNLIPAKLSELTVYETLKVMIVYVNEGKQKYVLASSLCSLFTTH